MDEYPSLHNLAPWYLFNFMVLMNFILLSSEFIIGRTVMSTVVTKCRWL
jgi:hypothetical protein